MSGVDIASMLNPYIAVLSSPLFGNILNIVVIYLLFILIRAFRRYIDKTVVLKATSDTASLLGLFTRFLNDEKRIINLNREFIQMALKEGWITREELKQLLVQELKPIIARMIQVGGWERKEGAEND